MQTLILAVVGIPAALAATWAVEVPYIGRRGTLAISSGKLSYLLSHSKYIIQRLLAEDRANWRFPFREYNRAEL